MEWNKIGSLRLAQVCVGVFALLLGLLDIFNYWLCAWYVQLRYMNWQLGLGMVVTFYLASVPGWLCLAKLWGLLRSIRSGEVFMPENVRRLRAICLCLAAASLIFALGAICYLPFLFAFAATGFLALIVSVVAAVFEQATRMKEELDLTV